jgi:hypothetical protein
MNLKQIDSDKNKLMHLLSVTVESLRYITTVLVFIALFATYFVYKGSRDQAHALPFGLGNDYLEVVELNEKFANTVPIPMESIQTTHQVGDKRVIALHTFLQKYNSPMRDIAVAKAFIENADKNGFGDSWWLLPAIAGIESGFGRLIPYVGGKSTFNAWGWSGGCQASRWSCFNSWEDAIAKVSTGMAKGYGAQNLDPNRIMAAYCPPCAASGGAWAKHVNGFIVEMNRIYKTI